MTRYEGISNNITTIITLTRVSKSMNSTTTSMAHKSLEALLLRFG